MSNVVGVKIPTKSIQRIVFAPTNSQIHDFLICKICQTEWLFFTNDHHDPLRN